MIIRVLRVHVGLVAAVLGPFLLAQLGYAGTIPLLGTSSTAINYGYAVSNEQALAQGFTVTADLPLAGIGLGLYGPANSSQAFTLDLTSGCGVGTPCSPVILSQNLNALFGDANSTSLVLPVNLTLAPGMYDVALWSVGDLGWETAQPFASAYGTVDDGILGSTSYTNPSDVFETAWYLNNAYPSANFQLYGNPANSVPEPPSQESLLLGLALVALVSCRRPRRALAD